MVAIRRLAALFACLYLVACGPRLRAGKPGYPVVGVVDKKFVVDGAPWLDAFMHTEQFLRQIQVLKDGAVVIEVVEHNQGLGRPALINVVAGSGLEWNANMPIDAEGLLSIFVHDQILRRDGTVDEAQFRRYAEERGITLTSRRDLMRATSVYVESRCPRSVMITQRTDPVEGNPVERKRQIDAQGSGTMSALHGDTVCLTGTPACLQIVPGLKRFRIALDCAHFE